MRPARACRAEAPTGRTIGCGFPATHAGNLSIPARLIVAEDVSERKRGVPHGMMREFGIERGRLGRTSMRGPAERRDRARRLLVRRQILDLVTGETAHSCGVVTGPSIRHGEPARGVEALVLLPG